MDIASIIGVFSGVSLIITAILIGGSVHNFFNIPGFMVVFGGTIAATFFTFQLSDVWAAFKAAYFVFREKKRDPNDMVATMISLCYITRREGIFQLGKVKTRSPFLKKVCNLIADGSEEDLFRKTMAIEVEAMKTRHFMVQDVFRKMGIYAPAFGMLGTLIGLIQMLSRLQNPESIGPAMAVALLTTFYGSLLSTLFFLPVAGKLRSRTMLEVINMEIIVEGGISILEDNNPLLVYEKLSSYIAAGLRRPMKRAIGTTSG
ncbi:MAG: MotA/TolQ/ExbB proton channel family protein [Deltaproteobacteria bacterium]|nr:MotA/TolQ/ExbB proton channel family protein [Deltaproteobacteria bacterium]